MAKGTETLDNSAWKIIDIPPVWLVAALILAWLSTQVLPDISGAWGPARYFGAGLVAGGIGLVIWAAATFRVYQTTVIPHQMPSRIITSGPFVYSRNPIYLGDVLVLLGGILWWGAWAAMILVPISALFLTRRFIAPEESRLKECFGLEFSNYAQKTRRWL
ncbi:MAG: isoprenylcysteine carboxylmethyltransferase family protein [Sulfitobacter sp.]